MRHIRVIFALFAFLLTEGVAAQSEYMSFRELRDIKDDVGIVNLDGAGGIRILSKRADLIVTITNARNPKITPKGKNSEGFFVYEVVVDRKDTKNPKVEISKRGDIDKIDFVATTTADYWRTYIVEDVEKPIRMEDQTTPNDVITNNELAEVEINSPIADLQIDCPKALGATIKTSRKSNDKSITVTSIIFPVKPIMDLRDRIKGLQKELDSIDNVIKKEYETPTLNDKQREQLQLEYDKVNNDLDSARTRFSNIGTIELFATGTNRLVIDVSEARPRSKFVWGVLLREVIVEKHVTDFNAKFSEGARLYGLREYDNARRNFLAAKAAKDAPSELIPSVIRNIADCDTCLVYENYAKFSLSRMKQMKAQGSGSQAEVMKYASGAIEFLKILNNYNPCDFYSGRIDALEKIVEEMPLDIKFTVTKWMKDFSGFSEKGRLANVELWADYGTGEPAYKDYQTDKRFRSLISEAPDRYKQLGVTGGNGELELHLVRKNLPKAIFFRPVGYGNSIHIMYMDVKDIMSQSEGEYNKRQFRLKMYVSEK